MSQKEALWLTMLKYFLHGILFSVLLLVLNVVWFFVLAFLAVVGSIIGLIIGIVGFIFIMGFLNSYLTGCIWSIPIETSWKALLIHGFVLFIVLLILQLPGLIISLVLPTLAVTMTVVIVYSFINGFVAKNVAIHWATQPVMVVSRTKVPGERLVFGISKNLLPIIVELAIVFPVIWIFSASLRSYSSLLTTTLQIIPPDPTLAAYSWVFFESPFWTWLRNSLFVCFLTTGFVILVASPTAYVMSRFSFLGKKPLLYALIFIQFVPGLLMFIAFFYLLLLFGLYDNLIGLVLVYTALLLPFNIWNLKAFFDTIPKDIDEAALIDGASYISAMFNVVFPVSLPGLAVTAFFSFLSGWNEFIIASLVLGSEENYTLPLGLYGLSQVTFQINWPRFAALSILGSIPLIVVFMFAQRYLRAGLAIGAVKG